MTLKSVILIFCNVLYQVQCEDTQSTESELDYNEFRLKHGDPLNYEEFIKKVLAKNITTTPETFGTAWQDFTDQTHLLFDLPSEDNDNSSTTQARGNYWNIAHGAKFMTFLPDNVSTTMHPMYEGHTTDDLTYFTYINWTFAAEKHFNEIRDLTRNTQGEYTTRDALDYMDHTAYDMVYKGNDTWLEQFANYSSSEERRLRLDDFYKFTILTTPPPSSTWNPFLIQSEERIELDRIAKEKRMAHNNAMRDAIKNNPYGGGMGGLGGLLGGLGGVIPVNLGGLMGGLRTITIVMGGSTARSTTKGSTTSPRSTISRKTFKPRPDPKDFMAWKFLEDGSPRPPMTEDEFIRILKKHGTPPPYHIPPVSIPAHIGEDIMDLMPNENTTIPLILEQDQLDRIQNFINPFIQQHTAMDLLNVDNTGRFTPPASTPGQRHTGTTLTTTTTTTTTRRTVETRLFTTQPPGQTHGPTPAWKEGWSRTHNTIDPFNQENLERALNEGREGELFWKQETFKPKPTFKLDEDPRVAALEKDFDNVFDKEAQKKRQEQGVQAKAELDRRREKYKQKGITKPSYWKEVIFKRPVEPLLEETSTAPKTEELKHLFSILSQGLTSAPTISTTSKPTTQARYWSTDSPVNPLYNWPRETQETKNRWTTPVEDKERLQTILSFMFPYIKKKSDIFETGKEKGSPATEGTTGKTTVFDPWGDTEEEDRKTPFIPELSKLFRNMIKEINTTTERR